VPLATMEIRAWGANRFHDPEGHGRYRHDPTPVRPVGHPYVCTAGEKDSGSVLLSGETPLEGTLVAPDSPCDACHAIGEGDSGDVVASGLRGLEGPGLECIGLRAAVSREKGRPSTVNEEYPEVAVAPFGDRPEPSGTPRGRLAGCEAEVVGKATA
jgi:hypothetical protein